MLRTNGVPALRAEALQDFIGFFKFGFFDFGFFIVQKQHEFIFDKIIQFLTDNYQTLKVQLDTTFIPQNFFFDCEYNKLPYTYNMIDMNRKEIPIDSNLSKFGKIFNFRLNLDSMKIASNFL